MSTFASFSTVRLGIYCAQKGLEVTGNNITNINTPGYTRQRLDQISLVVNPADRTASQYNANIGQGAFVTSVSQARSFSLDITYRNAMSDFGSANTAMGALNDLATILDEVGKGSGGQDDGVLLNQLNDLRDLISQAATNGIEEYDGLIRTSANALVRLFNSTAESLKTLEAKYETQFTDQVDTVNSLLERIQELNLSIRNCDLRGDNGLELRDQRNLLLDELSQYVNIDVTYTTEKVGASVEVERMIIKLAGQPEGEVDSKGNPIVPAQDLDGGVTLIDGLYAAKLQESYKKPDPNKYQNGVNNVYYQRDLKNHERYLITVSGLTDHNGNAHPDNLNNNGKGVSLGDNDLHGALQATREMITEMGEYSADVGIDVEAQLKRGVHYYQTALDHLARKFAETMNEINDTDAAGSGNLFSNSTQGNDDTNITAANISISQGWASGSITMQSAGKDGASSGDNSNLAKFLAAFDSELKFDPNDMSGGTATAESFTGSFEDMWLHIQSTMAEEQMGTELVLTNYMTTADEIYVNRDSVMGVDLNDEATSLMVYQKAYTSACRLLTVIDEALETLINTAV